MSQNKVVLIGISHDSVMEQGRFDKDCIYIVKQAIILQAS